MVVSETTRAWAPRDKALTTEASIPPEAQDASENSKANPRSVGPHQLEQEAYVTVDAFKNFMSTMTDTIMQPVTEQLKKAMEFASSTRPPPHFDYVRTTGCKPSH